jgi:hypothetical protein
MGIALILLVRISRYLRNELRIVPQNTFGQKFKVNLSIFMFSIILTATILFIAGIVSSAIASNASIALSGNIDEDVVSSFYLADHVAFNFNGFKRLRFNLSIN